MPAADTGSFADAERLALVGFLAGYRGLTRRAYTVDLRLFTAWYSGHGLALFDARRVDIECYARELEALRRARATVARRLCPLAGFYRYEPVLHLSRAAQLKRPELAARGHMATSMATSRPGRSPTTQ